MQPICDPESLCKCCGSTAGLFGVVDFNKNCINAPLSLSGIPIYYYRCRDCGFIFTTFFDAFTEIQFKRLIYNKQYIDVDPDFREARPRQNAQIISMMLGGNKDISILDYGGGSGLLGEMLTTMGFRNVETYDPLFPDASVKPTIHYDCIVCFEVVEHTTRPKATFDDIFTLLKESGVVIFSTLTQPADMEERGVNWWYIGPRNGHVSIYTRKSLKTVIEAAGLGFGSFSESWHLIFRNMPRFAAHLLSDLFPC